MAKQFARLGIPIPRSSNKGYVRTFVADDLVVYRFSASRSGETPTAVLGDSTGALVVDVYAGYNQITGTGKRTRSVCLSRARKLALDLIRDVYLVEHDAKAAEVVRASAHLNLRSQRSKPLMDKLHAYLTEQKPHHLPKGPMGKAVSYIVLGRIGSHPSTHLDELLPQNWKAGRADSSQFPGVRLIGEMGGTSRPGQVHP